VSPSARNTSFIIINVRSNPEMDAAVVGGVDAGATVEVLGRNYTSTWVQVRLPNGTTGWAFAQNLDTSVPVRSLAPSDGSVIGPQLPGDGAGAPSAPASPSTPSSPSSPTTPSRPQGGQYYYVRWGDTLSGIAWRYRVNMYTLAAVNGIYNLDRIYAGQRLYIP
jgi:LysM repeat protein